MSRKWSGLRVSGAVLIAIGLIWLLLAWNMNVSVRTAGGSIGGFDIPTRTVVNVGLLDDRRNQLMLGGLVTLAGVILLGFGSLRGVVNDGAPNSPPVVSSEPPCERDLVLEAYQLWLLARYAITRNEALEAFVCGDQYFRTVQEAMAHAHGIELRRI